MVWPDCRTAELQRGPQAGQRSMVVRTCRPAASAFCQSSSQWKHGCAPDCSFAAHRDGTHSPVQSGTENLLHIPMPTVHVLPRPAGRAAPGSYRGPGVPDAPAAVRTSKTKKDLGQTDPKYRLPSPAQSEPATLPAARDTPLLHTPYVHNSWAFHFPHCNAAQATPGAKNLPVRQSLSSV